MARPRKEDVRKKFVVRGIAALLTNRLTPTDWMNYNNLIVNKPLAPLDTRLATLLSRSFTVHSLASQPAATKHNHLNTLDQMVSNDGILAVNAPNDYRVLQNLVEITKQLDTHSQVTQQLLAALEAVGWRMYEHIMFERTMLESWHYKRGMVNGFEAAWSLKSWPATGTLASKVWEHWKEQPTITLKRLC